MIILAFFVFLQSVFGKAFNVNSVLYDRLMGSYRLDFVETDADCNQTQWSSEPHLVPDKCLEYVYDETAKYRSSL